MPGPCPDWRTDDSQSTRVPDPSNYTLRGAFITQLLSQSPYREVTAKRPITIYGARIVGDVIVRGGTSAARLIIACSTIDGRVVFVDRHMERGVDLSRVAVSGMVQFTNLRAGAAVSVSRSDVHAVEVIGGWIAGSFSLRGSRVRAGTLIASTAVERGIRMGCPKGLDIARWQGCRAEYGESNLLGVQVGGMIEAGNALFAGKLTLRGCEVGRGIVGQNTEYRGGLSLIDCRVKGRVQLGRIVSDATMHVDETEVGESVSNGRIHIDGTHIQGPLHLADGTYSSVIVVGSEVDGQLNLGASRLGRLDLSGTTVRGELRLQSGNKAVIWGEPRDDARFVARNTRVESLEDTEDSWPPWLMREFDGFEYEKLSGRTGRSGSSAYLRGAEWFKEWLAGDKTYSPQPYRHLSTVLRREGQREAANAILYEAKERERAALSWSDGERWWLEALRWTVGYGVGLNALWALAWMGGFALFGWSVSSFATRGRDVSQWKLLWNSVSYSVPGFSLVRDDEVRTPRWAQN